MATGYVVAIVVDGKPILFWKEGFEHACGKWTKNAQQATRSYSRESITDKYLAAGNSTLIPGCEILVVEERSVISVMTESEFERRRLHRIKIKKIHKTKTAD